MTNKKNIKLLFFFAMFFAAVSFVYGAQYSSQSMYAVLQGHDQQLKTLAVRMSSMQDSYATLVNTINSLSRQLQEQQQINQRLQNSIDALKQQIASDRQQYQSNLNNVINKVSEETSKAINTMSKQQAAALTAAQSQPNGNGPAGSGKFAEYVVQPGATLSAISKAYKVSIQDIKRANRMSDDTIMVGQKLYIPQN